MAFKKTVGEKLKGMIAPAMQNVGTVVGKVPGMFPQMNLELGPVIHRIGTQGGETDYMLVFFLDKSSQSFKTLNPVADDEGNVTTEIEDEVDPRILGIINSGARAGFLSIDGKKHYVDVIKRGQMYGLQAAEKQDGFEDPLGEITQALVYQQSRAVEQRSRQQSAGGRAVSHL